MSQLPAECLNNPHMPDAHWDVSGAFVNDVELIGLFDFFAQWGKRLFHIVHGSPQFIWNSGRVQERFNCSPEQVRAAGVHYVRRGVGIHFTFTSTTLRTEDVNDEFGNALLNFLQLSNLNGLNAAIVASDVLEQHIRTNYPQVGLVSSILKVTQDGGKGNADYYKELASRFDKVMLHPDDAYNFGLLKQLDDKDKYEIIVNEYCVRGCPIRKKHYEYLSNMSKHRKSYDKSFNALQATNGCTSLKTLLFDDKKYSTALSGQELQRVYDLGFRHFKIQGRGLPNALSVVLDLLRLTLPDLAKDDVAWFRLLTQCLEAMPATMPDPEKDEHKPQKGQGR